MEYFNDKIEKKDVFKDLTTYTNDYKKYKNYQRDLYRGQKFKLEKPIRSQPKPAYSDHESFDRWKDDAYVPSTLFIEPKPIIRTSPQDRFVKLDPSVVEDHGKLESIKTRPRVYMTPAVSMDDIPDPEMRKLLINRMYTTEWRNAVKEATLTWKKIIPEISTIETTDTVALKVDQYLPIGEQYRDRAKAWDDEQMRGYSDPTRDFWIHKDPPVVCGACVDPLKFIVPEEQKVVIRDLIAEEKLRQPHDLVCPTHTGYRPMLSAGVSLGKKPITPDHPMMTTNQVVTFHHEEELRNKRNSK
ncbi:unnamed protein product [Acanthoscelides obtectus]|uniref:Uncharacterized protein n=1 Tax=Acanthoscelides obtectus TaxID=200917 RepID=A0A9P0LXG3_ACAOB|nr:unnamed protein product [Acanthoscelides obtectus]CAK1675450.1 hypothetical protein AOBTE_LOCUS30229 [Acanthoscelides obtectus]